MERKFIGDDRVVIECTSKEAADIWYAVERALRDMESEGIQKAPAYGRLKAIEEVLNGK